MQQFRKQVAQSFRRKRSSRIDEDGVVNPHDGSTSSSINAHLEVPQPDRDASTGEELKKKPNLMKRMSMRMKRNRRRHNSDGAAEKEGEDDAKTKRLSQSLRMSNENLPKGSLNIEVEEEKHENVRYLKDAEVGKKVSFLSGLLFRGNKKTRHGTLRVKNRDGKKGKDKEIMSVTEEE